jgi:hypothetical protein
VLLGICSSCLCLESVEIGIDGIRNLSPSDSEAYTPSANEAALTSAMLNDSLNSLSAISSHSLEVKLDIINVTRPHPYVVHIPGPRTTACAAIFRSLSARIIDMWWEDGNGGLEQGSLYPGQESTTNSYQGQVFFFTDHNNKTDEIARVRINPSQVSYVSFSQ